VHEDGRLAGSRAGRLEHASSRANCALVMVMPDWRATYQSGTGNTLAAQRASVVSGSSPAARGFSHHRRGSRRRRGDRRRSRRAAKTMYEWLSAGRSPAGSLGESWVTHRGAFGLLAPAVAPRARTLRFSRSGGASIASEGRPAVAKTRNSCGTGVGGAGSMHLAPDRAVRSHAPSAVSFHIPLGANEGVFAWTFASF